MQLFFEKLKKYFLLDTEVKVRIRFRCSIALFSYNTIQVNGNNPLLCVGKSVGEAIHLRRRPCKNPQ